MSARRLAHATLAGAAALAALATPASAHTSDPVRSSHPTPERTGTSAGTIVFIKNHNVWIARGDGSGARALTRDGTFALPYDSPTQSDAGIVVATNNQHLVRMTQQGRVLNEMRPKPLPTSVGTPINDNLVDAAISPDGRRIAYTYTKYLSPPGAEPGFRSATGYTAADHLTDPAPLRTSFYYSPSWVGNSRTLQSGGFNHHVNIQDLGQAPVDWFSWDTGDFANTELSRDGRLLAGIYGYGENARVVWMAVSGNAKSGPPPAAPALTCDIGPAAGLTNPTWGPDSTSLAWQENDGIWTRSGGANCEIPSTLILPGGSEPHWSPAGLSAPVTTALRNLRRPAITGKAVLGRTLRATTGSWSPSGARFTYRWLRGSKVVGTGRAHRVTRADRGRPLVVRVTATKAGYRGASATSRAVRVRR